MCAGACTGGGGGGIIGGPLPGSGRVMAAGGGKPLCWFDMVGVILAGSGGRTASFIIDFGEYLGNCGDLKSCVVRAPKSDFPGCDNVSNMVVLEKPCPVRG